MTQSPNAFPARAAEPLTAQQAFEAMAVFLEAFWERDGRPDDSLVKILSWVQPVGDDRMPADPAMWADWLHAIDVLKKRMA